LDLHTNGGMIHSTKKCEVPLFGQAWFNLKSITKIISMSEMVDKYHVTYDSQKEDTFVVHLPTKDIKFKHSINGLYFYKPTEIQQNDNVKMQLLSSLEDNKRFYSSQQFEHAKKACNLYHALGHPSIPDMREIIRMNMITNNPITTKDVDLAERIFGTDRGTIKGKTTRRKPIPVVEDMIDIPSELVQVQEDVILTLDGMTVNSLKILTTISKHLYYRTAHYMPSTTAESY